jgi:hypothetical protein
MCHDLGFQPDVLENPLPVVHSSAGCTGLTAAPRCAIVPPTSYPQPNLAPRTNRRGAFFLFRPERNQKTHPQQKNLRHCGDLASA